MLFGLNLGATDGYGERTSGYRQERGPVAPVRPYNPTQERLTNTPSGETFLQVLHDVKTAHTNKVPLTVFTKIVDILCGSRH